MAHKNDQVSAATHALHCADPCQPRSCPANPLTKENAALSWWRWLEVLNGLVKQVHGGTLLHEHALLAVEEWTLGAS